MNKEFTVTVKFGMAKEPTEVHVMEYDEPKKIDGMTYHRSVYFPVIGYAVIIRDSKRIGMKLIKFEGDEPFMVDNDNGYWYGNNALIIDAAKIALGMPT